MNYKHASGFEKRKKRQILEEAKKQLPKITNFFIAKDNEDHKKTMKGYQIQKKAKMNK